MLDLVTTALHVRTAVPAVTTYDFTTAQAVVAASEHAARPVILLVPPTAAAGTTGDRLISALRGLADDAATPVCVQLDHATDLDLIEWAVAAGADAVLADGSALPTEDNAAFVAHVRDLVGPQIVVEAELGSLAGDEDIAHACDTVGMTDPADVPRFLTASGAQLLAVAVGNVHGHYKGTPHLDWDRIAGIRTAAAGTPLVLHGASGIPQDLLARTPTVGIGKININTELRSTLFTTLRTHLDQRERHGLNLLALLGDWREAAETFTSAAHRMATAHAGTGDSPHAPVGAS